MGFLIPHINKEDLTKDIIEFAGREVVADDLRDALMYSYVNPSNEATILGVAIIMSLASLFVFIIFLRYQTRN